MLTESVSATAGQINDLGSLSTQASSPNASNSDDSLLIGAMVAVIAALLAIGAIMFIRQRKT
jgi:hypothetical protein